jgi:enamidase
VATTLITDIDLLVTGRPDGRVVRDTQLVIEDGVVAAIGGDVAAPDRVISAGGLSVMPGLVDGHIHPTFGEWTPAQNSIGWMHNYLHGGTTSMVSAGELHVPGLAVDALNPELVVSLAVVSLGTTGRVRASGVKTTAGTVLLTTGMTQSHFDRLAEAGASQAKFIFYDWNHLDSGEPLQYIEWARDRGIVVKMHSGGVSRSGASRVAGYDLVSAVKPDIVAHISGGPIPMPDDEIRRTIDDLTGHIEVCSSMNYRATQVAVDQLTERDELHRLTLGTDTPGGTGVIPRGMLRNVLYLSSVCGMDPAVAVAAATGNTALAHGLDVGVIDTGKPADLLVLGPITGSQADTVLDCFALGDLPGIAAVLVDGEPVVSGRSEQTPPPRRHVTLR